MSLDESSGLAPLFGARLLAMMGGGGHDQVTLLARKLGVTKARVGELCNRDRPPKPETVLRLATSLGCDPSDLDPRMARELLPLPGSRVAKATEILAKKFKFRVEFVRGGSSHVVVCRRRDGVEFVRENKSHFLVCRRLDDAPDATPTAIVVSPKSEGGWGCLAETKLQFCVLEALNGHA